MNSNYQLLKSILNYLDEFENDSGDANLYDFAEWLLYKLKRKTKRNSSRNNLSVNLKNPEYIPFIKSLNSKNQFLEYIARIARYQEFYSRRFFEDLPINTRLEFLFLYTVETLRNVKKTDLINIHLVEYTTGMDTIKRLLNQDLIAELPGNADKRIKLLEITVKGRALLKIASKRIDDKTNMFLACINENKWRKIMPVLEEISDFHNDIYSKHYNKPYPELINLMDSLKHYYK